MICILRACCCGCCDLFFLFFSGCRDTQESGSSDRRTRKRIVDESTCLAVAAFRRATARPPFESATCARSETIRTARSAVAPFTFPVPSRIVDPTSLGGGRTTFCLRVACVSFSSLCRYSSPPPIPCPVIRSRLRCCISRPRMRSARPAGSLDALDAPRFAVQHA